MLQKLIGVLNRKRKERRSFYAAFFLPRCMTKYATAAITMITMIATTTYTNVMSVPAGCPVAGGVVTSGVGVGVSTGGVGVGVSGGGVGVASLPGAAVTVMVVYSVKAWL